MYRDLTRGSILRSLLLFALPMLAGDILQQLYNIADTLIVSHAIGRDALAAVGSAYTLMIFLTSILLGLSMGAAWATVIAQYFSGLGLAVFTLRRCPDLLPKREELRFDAALLREIFSLSSLTCVQQSVMNFGILMIQGLVNSFGEIVMAAFAAAVKIESFAYMPAQDFSNAFSTFVAQNFGARQTGRIRAGIRRSFALVLGFCAVISAAVLLFASPLMRLFIPATDTEVIREGVYYLRCVAPFYFGIGFLFLFYALYRAVKKPAMSVVLTVVSLGTRVALAYLTAGTLGVAGIWAAIPIGWVLADITGAVYYFRKRKALLPETGQ